MHIHTLILGWWADDIFNRKLKIKSTTSMDLDKLSFGSLKMHKQTRTLIEASVSFKITPRTDILEWTHTYWPEKISRNASTTLPAYGTCINELIPKRNRNSNVNAKHNKRVKWSCLLSFYACEWMSECMWFGMYSTGWAVQRGVRGGYTDWLFILMRTCRWCATSISPSLFLFPLSLCVYSFLIVPFESTSLSFILMHKSASNYLPIFFHTFRWSQLNIWLSRLKLIYTSIIMTKVVS